MSASLAYRKHEAAIIRGDAPDKYLRLLPFIPVGKVVEAGSAEGVLACLLACKGCAVTAIEANPERHDNAKKLAGAWGTTGGTFVNGRIEDSLHHLEGADTFVAVRAIYYWGEQLDAIFKEVAKNVPTVVLCGNKNRARRYHAGTPDAPLGEMNYYASLEGMRDLLQRHGYTIAAEVTEGDAIVVGIRE